MAGDCQGNVAHFLIFLKIVVNYLEAGMYSGIYMYSVVEWNRKKTNKYIPQQFSFPQCCFCWLGAITYERLQLKSFLPLFWFLFAKIPWYLQRLMLSEVLNFCEVCVNRLVWLISPS